MDVMLRRWAAALAFVAALLAQSAAAQATGLPEWHLRGPRQTVGGESLELHRVRAAGFLSGGEVVIADGGNSRVLVISADGRVQQSLGRAGSGPGDFQMLWDLAVIRDTIVTYDTGLQRVSLWSPRGTLLRTVSLLSEAHRLFMLRAFTSPTEYIVTAQATQSAGARGLYTDTVSILRFDGVTRASTTLDRRAWEQHYFYPEANATTAYRTPFLGQAFMVTTATGSVFVPLASASIEVLRKDGSAARTIPLPETQRPFDRMLIDAYRDSMIRLTRKSSHPGSTAENRLRDVFGSSFPLPMHRPVVEYAIAVGNEVWLRAFPTSGDVATWYVIDVANQHLVARLLLPAGWRVLGGNERSVLVLQRDSLDVETVAVFDIVRDQR